MGAKAHWFHPIAPRCVRATRWRRDASDPGRPGIVRAEGKVEMMWHPQTKGRATEKTNIDLEPCAVGADISESEIPADAVSGIGSGNSTQERDGKHKVSDRCFEQRRWRVQKARWRGKSPYSVVNVRAMGNAEISWNWIVPLAKDPNTVRTKPPPAATQRIPNEEQLRKAACGKTARAV